ncbi:MAG TPA: maltose alpha-D-glucosyltransferase [Stellaceae bacterium]|nr:maltose alpha-D-glucosyltransferase [Stellaceae bacterium]
MSALSQQPPVDTETASDPQWYKDAVIYQLHVKAFFDANDDGMGDFAGLTAKLDYLKSLGVTTLWLLPFYPSPLRDDGYDIADYRGINPSYGTMADFKRFVREAHARGLRVITELVVNHTSDQHPWFERARHAPPGSNHRNFYVWSDTDHKYPDTRIIFLDTEKSNWTWDSVAQAYYWHRFYSHQPDLNFDNPAVFRAIVNVMRYWLDMGVDGLRLDAVPYLCEREGTNNENLPETHAILKRLRAEIDAAYPDRMLLAEANQWPEDVLPYFGEGDECHMAFHFPLMPRIYMAVAQEDRHPITDIMRQTPDIPDSCQWAIFLRNHDELTLEMVTDQERDYLWNFYATDKRMRINLGIRRRLSPLMEGDRRRIDLLNSILMSMPGTPIVYYGDEIGMGDNVYLGDRDGVRTPMQWSPDRNGGFSRADPARLFLPPIQDPVYGYQSVNVEAQSRLATSPLNTVRRLIAARQTSQAFGRGSLTFLYPANRKVLAYVRSWAEEVILCVVNLSRSAQPVDLDLMAFKGRRPVEMLGRSIFPIIGDPPYSLTLQGHSFLWFTLVDANAMANTPIGDGTAPEAEPLPEFVTLVTPNGWSDVLTGRTARVMETDVLPIYMPLQRWYGAKDQRMTTARILGAAEVRPTHGGDAPDGWALALAEVHFRDAAPQRYLLPLGLAWGPTNTEPRLGLLRRTLADVRRFRREGALFDATGQEGLTMALLDGIGQNLELPVSGGIGGLLRFSPTTAWETAQLPENPEIHRLGVEQSNSSVRIGEFGILKLYRRLQSGRHPEIEMGRYLTDVAGFAATPPVLGSIELVDAEGGVTAIGVLAGFTRNQGDAWSVTLDFVKRSFEDATLTTEPHDGEDADDPYIFLIAQAGLLGQRTAELHLALCRMDETDSAFKPEPITKSDITAWCRHIEADIVAVFEALTLRVGSAPALPPELVTKISALLDARDTVLEHIRLITDVEIEAVKTRFHGDYHLGQVLVAQHDFVIIDFEGEPRRTLEERQQKYSALKDVAGMLRSFAYAGAAAVKGSADLPGTDVTALESFTRRWCELSTAAFLERYRKTIGNSPIWPQNEGHGQMLLELLILEKVFYEIGYELANRPAWLDIPVSGALDLIDSWTEEVPDGSA